MMKNILIIITAMLIMWGCAKIDDASRNKTEPQIKQAVWTYNIEDAVKTAKEQDKAVLVNFTGSDWCDWCFNLRDEIFKTPAFSKYAEKSLVLVELDYPQRKEQPEETQNYNRKILDKYAVIHFLTIILLDKSGNEIGRTGYRKGGAAAYIEHLQNFIK